MEQLNNLKIIDPKEDKKNKNRENMGKYEWNSKMWHINPNI